MAERRLELDGLLKCPHCGCVPYRVFRRQLAQADGTLLPSWESVLWPAMRDVLPPQRSEHIECPDCRGVPLRRVAP